MKPQKIVLITLLGLAPATFITTAFAEPNEFPPSDFLKPDNSQAQSANVTTGVPQLPRVPSSVTMPMRPGMPAVPQAQPRYYPQNPYNNPYNNQYNTRSYPPGFAAPNYGAGYAPRYTPYPQQRNYGNRPYPGNNQGNNSFPFSGGNMPFLNNGNNGFNNFPSNPMNNMFGNNSNSGSLPFFKQSHKNRKKAWGKERNIWPDFYTDFTDDAWDSLSSGPRDLGYMPGGWRFPHISTPDPVTVSDAITNQLPPMAEEGGNMMNISDWGIFDDK